MIAATGTTATTRTPSAFSPASRGKSPSPARRAAWHDEASPAKRSPRMNLPAPEPTFRGIRCVEAARRVARLRERDKEIIDLLADGQDAHQISVLLDISRRTIDDVRVRLLNELCMPGEPRNIVRAVVVYLAAMHGRIK